MLVELHEASRRHDEMIDAIADHDPDRAEALVRAHSICRARTWRCRPPRKGWRFLSACSVSETAGILTFVRQSIDPTWTRSDQ
ncbi:hypothetical protein [Ensifer sp. YR511]|uniref:hypothetical protein n=1 Tax=Ensifer sp. YR511 TaxID=1855294 RepID=UPI00115FCE6D